jgi:hypothetical protein
MSTILKALRRLEEQKSEAAARPLRDEVVLAPTRRATRGAPLRVVVAGVALSFAAAALFFALRHEPVNEPEVADAAPTPAPVAAAPPADTITVAAAPAPPTPDTVVPVPPAPRDFEIVRPDPNAAPRPLAPPPLPTIRDAVAEAPPAEAPGSQRPGARSAVPEYVEEPLEEAPEPKVAAHGSAPVRVARTLWHPSPDRRLAWVEVEGQTALREVREGERIGPYVVREIEPAAVTFADGNVELRREVGP